MSSSTHKVPGSPCPECNTLNDAATGLGGAQAPCEGDICICFSCATVLSYDKDMKLQKMSKEQIQKIPSDLAISVNNAVAAIKNNGRTRHR